jgi:hypothetical protein
MPRAEISGDGRRKARWARAAPALVAAAAALALAPPADATPLSGRHHVTWASADAPWRVWTGAGAGARTITRLRLFTEDGYPEVYLVVAERVDAHGRHWVRLRYPRRPNGTLGWVRRDALGGFHVNRELLVIDRRRMRAALYERGRAVWRAAVGVGKPSTPTPAGFFWVREKFPVFPLGSIYGNFALGTAAYSRLTDWPGGGVVGVHGTNMPWLIPGRPSHGCVRVRDPDMARLYRRIEIGTPIRIR